MTTCMHLENTKWLFDWPGSFLSDCFQCFFCLYPCSLLLPLAFLRNTFLFLKKREERKNIKLGEEDKLDKYSQQWTVLLQYINSMLPWPTVIVDGRLKHNLEELHLAILTLNLTRAVCRSSTAFSLASSASWYKHSSSSSCVHQCG